MATTSSNHLETLPAWARELAEKYYSRTISMFVLHGNVRDLAPWNRAGGAEFLPLQRFLKEALFGSRDLVLFYDRGGGISFGSPEMKGDFERAISSYDSYHGTNFAGGLPPNPQGVLTILNAYLRARLPDIKKAAPTSAFTETIIPADAISSLP